MNTGALVTIGIGVGVYVLWAVTKYLTRAVALMVVSQIGDSLQPLWQADLDDALEPIRSEVTTNGGGSLKDRVLSVERQLEQLLTADR